MRFHSGLLLSVAAVASIVVLVAPATQAQCAPAQVFGSTGLAMLGMVQVEIGGGLTGTEIGRFWNAGNSASANNFAETCPATLWMVNRTASGNRGISGGIGESPCFANTCPTVDDEMIWLIEDYGPSGPPGVGDTAHFIGFRMDATPSAARYWDLARASGNVPATLSYLEFPSIYIIFLKRFPPIVQISFHLADAGLNFWGANAGGEILDSESIVSFDLCSFHGPGDPGRLRANWDCSMSIPYADGPAEEYFVDFDCPDDGDDTFVAVGITFSGGTGPDVPSELVGPAHVLECDPNLADPDSVPHLQQRPYVQPKLRRSGR